VGLSAAAAAAVSFSKLVKNKTVADDTNIQISHALSNKISIQLKIATFNPGVPGPS
jgi:hypothetical protein